MIPLFGRPVPVICMITNHVLDFIYNNHSMLITEWNNSLLRPNLLEVYANAVHQKGAALQNCFGFIDEGKRHDSGMLGDSGLLRDLEQRAFSTLHDPMCMYGDPAYPHRVHLQSPFREAVLTDDMKLFNASMSACRISLEWLFGDEMRQALNARI